MDTNIKERLIKKFFTARYIADKSILRYEIFCQSIQLAVEQIQEVEIDILKKKQEAKIESVFSDLIILYFIEAKILGTVVQKASQQFVDSFYRTRFLSKYYSSNAIETIDHNSLLKMISEDVVRNVDKTIDNLEKATTDALQAGAKLSERKFFQDSGPRRENFNKGTGNWVEAFNQKLIRPYNPQLSRWDGYNPNVAKGFPLNQGGDSPSVATLKSAFSNYSNFQQSVNSLLSLTYEEIMLLVVSEDDFMAEDLERVLDEMILEDKSERNISMNYDQIRSYLSIEIEKLIWVALYGKSMSMISGGLDINQIEDPGVIKGVDSDDRFLLQNYWWARFPDPESLLPFPNKYKLYKHLNEVYSILLSLGIEDVIKNQ